MINYKELAEASSLVCTCALIVCMFLRLVWPLTGVDDWAGYWLVMGMNVITIFYQVSPSLVGEET